MEIFMKMRKTLIAITLLCLNISACQQPSTSDTNSTQSSESIDVNEMPITTPEEFKNATSKTGNAQGNTFSREYIIESTGMKYGSNCKSDFVKATDFFINKALSEDEITNDIQNGGDPKPGFLTL